MRIWGVGAVFSSIGWVESFVFIVYDLQAQYTLRERKMVIACILLGWGESINLSVAVEIAPAFKPGLVLAADIGFSHQRIHPYG